MIVIVTGSRDWRDLHIIADELKGLPAGSVVRQGCATGADAIARSFAIAYGHEVDDNWPDYAIGLTFAEANKVRNQRMADKGADFGLAFPTEHSRGTWHCVTAMQRADIPVKIVNEDGSHRWIPEDYVR